MYRSMYMQCIYSAQDSFYISQKITLKLVYCQVLYGALTSLDRLGLFSAGRPLQSGQSEQHNVLPLTSCPSRFTLLPISTQPIRSSIQAPALQKSLYKAKVGGKYIEIQATFKIEKLKSTSSYYPHNLIMSLTQFQTGSSISQATVKI